MKRGVSLVVATLGARDLRPLLDSLEAQTANAYECIIIDQNPSRAIEKSLSTYRNIRYVHSDKKGNSYNRNIGIRLAKYPLIGFPDDDCVYKNDVIANVLTSYPPSSTVVGVSGVWADSVTNTPVMCGRGAQHATPWNIWAAMTNLTIFLNTEIVRTVGGYSEYFGLGSGIFEGGEETDLILKILDTGATILYTDTIVVQHRQDKYVVTNPTKQAGYEEAWGALFKKWTAQGEMRRAISARLIYTIARTILISLYYFSRGNFKYAKAYWRLNTYRLAGWRKFIARNTAQNQ